MKYVKAISPLWRLAVREAVAARNEFVDPEHFIEAISRGRDCCGEAVLRELQALGVDGRAVMAELRLVPDVLESGGINPTELRRAVRAHIGTGEHQHEPGGVVHR